MHDAFKVHMLNTNGKRKAHALAESFDKLVTEIDLPEGRYKAIVLTKLEEACFFAKKAIASQPDNNEGV